MITPELITHIRQQRALGKTREEISNALILGGGWQRSDIDQAFSTIESTTPQAPSMPQAVASHADISAPSKPTRAPSRVVTALVGIAIAILFNMFFYYSYQTLFKNEDSGDGMFNSAMSQELQRCYDGVPSIYTKDQCFSAGGTWNEYVGDQMQYQKRLAFIDGKEVQVTGTCDLSVPSQKCQEEVREKYSGSGANTVPGYVYNRNKFIAGIIMGVTAIIVAMTVTLVPAIAMGLSLGGVALLIGASFRFWMYLSSPIRVVIVFIALVAVVYFAWKKLKRA